VLNLPDSTGTAAGTVHGMREDQWSEEPADPASFTARFDRVYSRTAQLYAAGVRVAPFWRSWLRTVLPHVRGPRVLEASFGTGWLLTQYADDYETHGIDLNAAMASTARRACERAGVEAHLCRADVETLPYRPNQFDTVVSTMAFSGYPDAAAAMGEFVRVLNADGRVVMVDVSYPPDNNRLGTALARAWRSSGDIIRDIPALLSSSGFGAVIDDVVGGRGSIHLYVAQRTT
jgi:ubiquinone/menaquinone biosynthesis C-methylase UbiE